MTLTHRVSMPAAWLTRLAMGCLAVIPVTGCATNQTALITSVFGEQRKDLADLAAYAEADTSTVALVTALSDLVPDGRSFAYAPDVDISMPVRRPDSSLSAPDRLSSILSAAGLQARDVGTVIFVQRAGGATSDAAPAAPMVVAEAAAPTGSSRLVDGTLMNAPVVAPDDAGDHTEKAAEVAAAASSASDLATAAPLADSGPDVQVTAPTDGDAAAVEQPVAKVSAFGVEMAAASPDSPRRNWARRSSVPAETVAAKESQSSATAAIVADKAESSQPDVTASAPVGDAVTAEQPVAEVSAPVVEATAAPAPDSSRRNWARRSQVPADTQMAAVPSASAPAGSEQVLAHAGETASEQVAAVSPDVQAGAPVTLGAPPAVAEPAASPSPPQTVDVKPAVPEEKPVMPEVAAPAAGSVPAEGSAVETAVNAVAAETSLDESMGADVQPRLTAAGAATVWTAQRGDTLRATLEHWSEREGVQLVWRSEYDYPLGTSLSVPGDYEGAVRLLLGGFANAAPQPYGQLHRQGGTGARVLIVTSRGNDYAD